MSSDKKTMIILLVAAVILFAVAVGIWWHLFFGTPNPPLPRADVSIASSSASSGAAGVASATTAIASSSAAANTIADPTAGAATNSAENPQLSTEQLSVDGAAFNVEMATNVLEQSRGLSFRTSLAANDGMLFIFGSATTQSFWMKDMNFPLDMIWINGTTVIGSSQNVPAPAPDAKIWQLPVYTSPGSADTVLEVSAGTVAKYNIKAGDTITIKPNR